MNYMGINLSTLKKAGLVIKLRPAFLIYTAALRKADMSLSVFFWLTPL